LAVGGITLDCAVEELDAGKPPSVSDEDFTEALDNSWRPCTIPEDDIVDSTVIATLLVVAFSELKKRS
jgi:hypothetical protein